MNRFIGCLLMVLTLNTVSLAVSTNIVGTGSETITLSGFQFIAGEEENAITAANIAGLNVYLTDCLGGGGNASAIQFVADAGHGISLGSVNNTTVSNTVVLAVQGGNGGSTATQSSGSLTATARGGHGVTNNIGNTLNFIDGTARGGNGGTATGRDQNTLKANGGNGLFLNGAGNVSAGEFYGGTGGSIVAVGTVNALAAGSTAKGGDGINVGAGIFSSISSISNILAQGGDGGSFTKSAGTASADISGGNGLVVQTVFSDSEILDGTFEGGNGGTVSSQNTISGGGHGFSVGAAGTVAISNGVFRGGNAGTNSLDSSGGHGVDVRVANSVVIEDGEFHGGSGPTSDLNGAGVSIENASTVAINGGEFYGLGLSVLASFRTVVSDISDANFEDARFFGSFQNDVSIENTLLRDIELSGSGTHNFSISNSTFNGLSLADTSSRSIALDPSVTVNGSIIQTGGTTDFSLWSNSQMTDVTIEGGIMSFNGDLNLLSASVLHMVGGQLQATGFVAEAGSDIITTVSDTTNGVIVADTVLIDNDADWHITGTVTVENATYDLAVASAETNLTAPVFEKGTHWTASVVNPNSWIVGIENVVSVSNKVQAIVGVQSLDAALGLDDSNNEYLVTYGDDYLNAAIDFGTYASIPGNESVQSNLIALGSSASANAELSQAFMHTPEVANVLIRQQEVYSDQIRERTGSFIHQKNFAASYTLPAGASGPENWETEHWYEDTRDAIKGKLPNIDVGNVMRKVDEGSPKLKLKGEASNDLQKPYMSSRTKGEGKLSDSTKSVLKNFEEKSKPYTGDLNLPASYQVWGQVYSSWLDQQAVKQFAGYDARVYGAVVGADRRFGNMMVGLAGGIAETSVDGNSGQDGDALSGYGVVYVAAEKDGFYLDLSANYALSTVETELSSGSLNYKGEYDSDSLGLFIGSGYSLELFEESIYNTVLTPEISLLSTYYAQDAFTERADLGPDKNWEEYDQWSYLSSLGITLSKMHKIQSFKMEMEFKPELRAHWLHEFNADMDELTYALSGGSSTINMLLQSREEDLLKVGGGVRFNSWYSDSLEFGLDFDGTFGKDYTAYVLSGKLLHRF